MTARVGTAATAPCAVDPIEITSAQTFTTATAIFSRPSQQFGRSFRGSKSLRLRESISLPFVDTGGRLVPPGYFLESAPHEDNPFLKLQDDSADSRDLVSYQATLADPRAAYRDLWQDTLTNVVFLAARTCTRLFMSAR